MKGKARGGEVWVSILGVRGREWSEGGVGKSRTNSISVVWCKGRRRARQGREERWTWLGIGKEKRSVAVQLDLARPGRGRVGFLARHIQLDLRSRIRTRSARSRLPLPLVPGDGVKCRKHISHDLTRGILESRRSW